MADTIKDPRNKTADLVASWFRRQSQNPYGAFHLYYKQAPDGDLAIEEEAPEGYELGSAERISPAWDIPTVEYKIREWTRRLPILG